MLGGEVCDAHRVRPPQGGRSVGAGGASVSGTAVVAFRSKKYFWTLYRSEIDRWSFRLDAEGEFVDVAAGFPFSPVGKGRRWIHRTHALFYAHSPHVQ